MGPYPMWIDKVSVLIDGQGVYKFECPPDSLCNPPADRLPLDPALTGEGEHTIKIEVLGVEMSWVNVSIEHPLWWGIRADGKRR